MIETIFLFCFENHLFKKGVSWSIGGDYTFDSAVTLPNILRLYNPKLKGFSTKQSLIFGKGQNSSHNALNAGRFDLNLNSKLNFEHIFKLNLVMFHRI